jgi:hypothetical protein
LQYGLSLIEYVILKSGKKKQNDVSSFNFVENETKLTYAKTKFLISVVIGSIYYSFKFIFQSFFYSDFDDTTSFQSIFLFLVLATLCVLREKFEKQILKKNSLTLNHLSRMVYSPFIFTFFALFLAHRTGSLQFLLNTLLFVSLGYFFYEDFRDLLGFTNLFGELPLFMDSYLHTSDEAGRFKNRLSTGFVGVIIDFGKSCYEN